MFKGTYLKDILEVIKKNFFRSLIYKGTDRPKNVLIYGAPGVGKTSATRSLFMDILGCDRLDNGIYQVLHPNSSKTYNVGFMELHGGTMDVSTVMIPTTVEVDGKKVLKYILCEEYERILFGKTKLDLFCCLIQDVNRNSDLDYNNFIKSLVDGKIRDRLLPPTLFIMTANPSGSSFGKVGKFINTQIDTSVTSTCNVFYVDMDIEDAIKYMVQPIDKEPYRDQVVDFLRKNQELFTEIPEDPQLPFGCPRSITSLLDQFQDIISTAGYPENLIEVCCHSRIGEKGYLKIGNFLEGVAKNKKRKVSLDFNDYPEKAAEFSVALNEDIDFDIERFIRNICDRAIPLRSIYDLCLSLKNSTQMRFMILLFSNQKFVERLTKQGRDEMAIKHLYFEITRGEDK